MKNLLLALVLVFNFTLFAQIDCVNFGDYSDDYVSEVGFNDEDYPPGTTFMESAFIQIIKPEGETTYLSTGSDEFTFIGNVDIDVSELDCHHKVLTFSLAVLGGGSTWINVNGEVVGDMAEPFPLYYAGDGWECEYDGESDITIIGDFDLVNIYGSTNVLSDCCLDCNTGDDCIDFADYTTPYVDSVGWDDDTYPAGSVFMENGDIKLIKPDGETNYLSVTGSGFSFVGDVTIDVSGSDCINRFLTFDIVPDPSNAIRVDDVLVSDEFEDWPAAFDGDDFDFTLVDGTVTIAGFFNQVHLFGSTNILNNVCLDCDTNEFLTDCIPFNDYSDDYVSNVGTNDEEYPPGSVFMENGALKLVKPEGETNYLTVADDGMFFVGNVDIDVTTDDTDSCDNKILTFTLIPDPSNGLSVDGEIISDEFEDWPSSYEGDGFYFEIDDDGNCTITGESFDVVSLFGSTNILSNVCLDCEAIETDGIIEIEGLKAFEIYPNPAFNVATIKLDNANADNYQLAVTNLSGQTLFNASINGINIKEGYLLDIQNFENGVYLVTLQSQDRTRVMKLVKG